MAVIQGGASADLASVNPQKQLLTTDSTRTRSGVYVGNSGRLSMSAAAHTATNGFMWLLNPLSSSKLLAVRRIEVDSMGIAVAAVNTRINAERMAFTGNPTAAQVASGKIDSTYPNPSGYLTNATSGTTPTAGQVMYSFWCMAVITAVGIAEPVETSWNPAGEAGMPVLRPGEGLVLRQPDAGVAGDPRVLTLNIAWEEF